MQEVRKMLPERAGKRPRGVKPLLITLHIQEGFGSLYKYFQGAQADSTLWISKTGVIERYLEDNDTPWTNGDMSEPLNHSNPVIQGLINAGVSNSNRYCLTIEHEGYHTQMITDAQIESSAQAVAYFCKTWNIPCNRTYVIGHYEIGEHKLCPGSSFPFDKIIARAQQILGSAQAPAPQQEPQDGSVEGADGQRYWIVYPIRGFFESNSWLGLPLNSMSSLADRSLPGDGVTQDFQRGRIEVRKDARGNYQAPELGLVNQELIALKNK